jgi:hypothetical protein
MLSRAEIPVKIQGNTDAVADPARFELTTSAFGGKGIDAQRRTAAAQQRGARLPHLNVIGIVPIFAVRAAHCQPPLDGWLGAVGRRTEAREAFMKTSKRDDVRQANPGRCRDHCP